VRGGPEHGDGEASLGSGGGPGLVEPGSERVWPVELEEAPTAWLWVELVGEAGLNSRADIEEGERTEARGDGVRKAGGVAAGLGLDAGEGVARRLGLHDADRLPIYEEEIVGVAVPTPEGELAQRDAACSDQIRGLGILDDPASSGERHVNVRSSVLLRCCH